MPRPGYTESSISKYLSDHGARLIEIRKLTRNIITCHDTLILFECNVPHCETVVTSYLRAVMQRKTFSCDECRGNVKSEKRNVQKAEQNEEKMNEEMSIVEVNECEEEIVKETMNTVVFCLEDLKTRFQSVPHFIDPNDNKKVWFFGKKVAMILGYDNPHATVHNRLHDNNKRMISTFAGDICIKGYTLDVPFNTNSTDHKYGKGDTLDIPLTTIPHHTISNMNKKFLLVMRSRLPSCAQLMEWIVDTFMKNIFDIDTGNEVSSDRKAVASSDVLVSIGPNKNSKCLYLYHLLSYTEPPYSFYKYGYSIGDIEKRDSAHRRAFGEDIVLTHIEVSSNPKDLESDFKRYAR